MPWKCFAIKAIRMTDWESTPHGGQCRRMMFTLPDGREVGFDELPPGAMWHSDQQPRESYLAGADSIQVKLPGPTIWSMNRPGTNGCKWDVSGEIPNVTASPSINFVGLYHGWVQNGVVSDDVEGRKFDEMGRRA
jgi:hypothetical protein